MAVRKVGVEAVIENLGSFLNGVSQMNSGIVGLSNAAKLTDGTFQIMGATFNKQMQRFRDANGQFVSTTTVMDRMTGSIAGVNQGALSSVASLAELAKTFLQLYQNSELADQELQQKPEDMANAGQAGISLQEIIGTVAAGFSRLGAVLAVAGQAIRGITGFFGGLINAVGKVISAFSPLTERAWDVAKGYLFGKMLQWVSTQLKAIGQEAVTAAAQFQLLEIRFRTIAQRDLANELGVTIPEAFDKASQKAKQLLEWVRQIAVTTPFKASDVARSLALANAYGLTADEARVLVGATLDFAAAMGLTEDHIYRIIYNFGQMQSQGKLTGREFRDLAISFVPIHDILGEMAEAAGKTKEEMEKLALEGGVPVEEFFRRFVQMVQRDFKGAAEEMAKTLAGVWDNIKDTFELLIGVDFLGPIAQSIASGLDKIMQLARGFREGAMILGGVFNRSVLLVGDSISRYLLPALGELLGSLGFVWKGARGVAQGMANFAVGVHQAIRLIAEGISAIAKWISGTLGKIQENGHTWGYNLVMQFARGMAAAVKAIIAVIGTIARIIANFFSPGSPPKVAPDIDKWGYNMMEEWANGIESAGGLIASSINQSIAPAITPTANAMAGNITSAVTNALQSARDAVQPLIDKFGGSIMGNLVKGFSLSSLNLFRDLAGVTEDFIRSLEGIKFDELDIVPKILGTRDVIAKAVEGIRSGILSVTDAVSKITKAMGDAPVAFKDYVTALFSMEKAQANLAAAQKLGNSVLESNEKILSRMSGAVKEAGRAYVESLNRMTRAEEETKIAEEALAEVTKFYDEKLRDLKDALEQVTEVYDEKKELQEIDKALATQILTTAERERLEMKKRALLIKAEIRETERQRDIEVGAAKDRVDNAREVEEAAKEEADKRQKYLVELAEAQAQAAEDQLEAARAVIEIQTEQNDLIREQLALLEKLANAGAGGGAENPLEDLASSLEDLMGDLETFELPNVDSIIEDIMSSAVDNFLKWKEDIKAAIAEVFGYKTWEEALADLDAKLLQPLGKAFENVNAFINRLGIIVGFYAGIVKEGIDTVSGSLDELNKTLDSLGLTFDKLGFGPSDFLLGMAAALMLMVATPILVGLGILNGLIDGLNEGFSRARDAIQPFVDKINLLLDTLADLKEEFAKAEEPIEKFKLGLLILGGYVDLIWQGIQASFTWYLNSITGFVEGFVEGIIEFFTNLYNTLVGESIVPEMMQAIYDSITGVLTDIQTWVNIKLQEIADWFGAKFTEMATWVSDKMSAIKTTVETKTAEVKTEIETKVGEIKKFWEEKWEAIRKFFDDIWNDKNGVVQTLHRGIDNLKQKIDGPLNDAIEKAKEIFDGLKRGIDSVKTAIGNVVDAINDFISAVLSDAFRRARDILGFLTGESPSPLAIGISYASKELDKFKNAIRSFIPEAQNMRMASQPVYGGINNSRNVSVNVNANYANTQSPVDIYYDISAALASANM